MCAPCRVLSTRPLTRQALLHLKVRDLQCFLHRQNVSTRACVEKEDLISLVMGHVNSAAYRRRSSRGSPGAFSSLKGFTNNINDLLNSAFDIRSTAQNTRCTANCFNSAHAHSNPRAPASPPTHTEPHRTQPTRSQPPTNMQPSDINYRPPSPVRSATESSTPSDRHETADCFEIEDLDDAGWEFVTTPAEPLPNDSEILLTEQSGPHRAASELELRPPRELSPDTTSLKDESFADATSAQSESQLGRMSVKQLKEMLALNRVDYRGCVERVELEARARRLLADRQRHGGADLPIEDSCKICMAAPLECVLLECGHIAACTNCAKQLAECPICRQYVVRAVRCFRS